jgi:4-amino-4-deoxy-L-arabinose transferase-like glycosyltransferase
MEVPVSLGVAHPPALSPGDEPAAGRPRPRWAFWRSPAGQPGWARPALLGIAVLAATLYAWNITQAGLAPFYSTAVKSMSESWHAFFYGAFDPKATVTIDKLAGSFLPQALSARIFGFHPWSLALPQVIEGVIAVLVMYRIVRRWAGVIPGLLAAGIFTLTPVAASMFGHSMEDGALTMCLVLAADSYQRAVTDARLRSLIWSGVWVGLGFQAKMLQAWMILPALAAGYLLSAPAPLRRRLGQLAAAGAVMLAVSLSWIALYTLTPAADRPYVDGSTSNSAVAMAFGYNGLERLGVSVPGAVTSGPGVSVRNGSGPAGRGLAGAGAAGAGRTAARPGGGVSSAGFTGNSGGWAKLIGSRFGPEIGWLYPLALLALVLGLISRGRARRTDRLRGGLVMWGTWLLTFGVTYSVMGNLPHTAYVAALAPPIAALSGTGIVMFWRWYRAGHRLGWVLPAAVAAELGWAAYLWSGYRGFLPWVLPAAAATGVLAIGVMVAARLSRRALTRLATAGLVAGVLAMLAAPAAWAGSVLDTTYAGTSFDAGAGPAGAFSAGFRPAGAGPAGQGASGPAGTRPPGGSGGPAGLPAASRFRLPSGFRAGASGPGGGILGSATTTLSTAERRIYGYVSAHGAGASYLLAVQSWTEASPYILATGREVLPLGGFSGSVPVPTLSRVRQLVATGQLRFFLLGGASPGPGIGRDGSQAQLITRWVESACATVPARDYGGTSPAAGSLAGAAGRASGSSGTLYECRATG